MVDPDSLGRWSRLLLRANGPLSFRFLIQPTVALFLGIRAGIRDARKGKPSYFWAVFTHQESRLELIKNGWKDVAQLFILAVVLDMLVQWIMFKWIYPGGALIVGFFLTIVTYLLVRGPANRVVQGINQRRHRPNQ